MDIDTIAALSTPLSTAGIGIIRVSGKEAVEVVDKVYKGKKPLSSAKSHTIQYGYIVDNSEKVDEVLVSVMLAPRSYTRENVVEINCHGGIQVLRRVLSLLYQNGARPAEAGEFTKRAFLNGRIDLAQAESVMDLIQAQNEFSRRNSLRQLSGKLSTAILWIRGQLLQELAVIESALDDPEHYTLEGYGDKLSTALCGLVDKLKTLLSSYNDGKVLKEGIETVIVGRPNVGKSSLMNFLAEREKAIVTDIPGTTRDMIEETVSLGDITLRLVDTAGIRETEDAIEKIGVEKSLERMDEADLVLYMADSSKELGEEDFAIIEAIKNRKAICLLNKSDLKEVTSLDIMKRQFTNQTIDIIPISVKEDFGLNELKTKIQNMFLHGELSSSEDIYVTNERQRFELESALQSLKLVQQAITDGMTEDFFTVDLMDAYAALGRIIGEEVQDDLVDKIFLEFCMGK